MSLTDYLDVLRNVTNAEIILRQEASIEYADGNHGPMAEAHKVSIDNVIKAAKQLIEYQSNEQHQSKA